MPRVGVAPARDPAAAGRAHHGRLGDHDRLRQIHSYHGRKIIRLSPTQSRSSRIDRSRRRRKSGGLSASHETVGKHDLEKLPKFVWSESGLLCDVAHRVSVNWIVSRIVSVRTPFDMTI